MGVLNGAVWVLVLAVASCAGAPAQEATPPVMPRIQETPLPPPVTLPPPDVPPADLPAGPLTEDEAVRIALRNQPDVAAAAAAVEAARGRAQQARSGLLPSLGASLGYRRTDSLSVTGGFGTGPGDPGDPSQPSAGDSSFAFSGFQSSVTVRQLLFDFERTRSLARQARAQERSAAAGAGRVRADLAQQVRQQFHTLVQGERLVEVNEANVRSQQAHLALARARVEAGLGPPIDVVRAQTAVAEAILDLNLARSNALLARTALAELMGIDPRTPLRVEDVPAAADGRVPVEALVRKALARRPEMEEARQALVAAEQGVEAARRGDAPSFSADVGFSGRGASLSMDRRSASVGTTIRWTPFDSGLTAGRVREARAGVESARARLRAVELQVTGDVSRAYVSLHAAEQREETARAEEDNAQEAVRLAQGRYRAGVGTFIEVTDAQTALLAARTNLVNARSAISQARTALSRAVGEPPVR